MKKYLFIFLTLCNVYYAKGTFNGVGLSSYEGQLGFNFIRQFGMSSDDIINEDEGGEKQSQLGTFGLMIDANKNILRISKYGFIYN